MKQNADDGADAGGGGGGVVGAEEKALTRNAIWYPACFQMGVSSLIMSAGWSQLRRFHLLLVNTLLFTTLPAPPLPDWVWGFTLVTLDSAVKILGQVWGRKSNQLFLFFDPQKYMNQITI